MLRDRNLAAGLAVMFMMGIILLGTLALLTPFLQQLLGYPVLSAGMVLAPRGMGTMVAMIIVGRLGGRIDERKLLAVGFALIAFALWEMSEFNADVSYEAIGCSISQAAASVMSDLVIGKSVDEAMDIHGEFLALMQGKGAVTPDEEVLEDGVAFAGVARFPSRVKCALLSWMAWKDATTRSLEASNG